MGKLANTLGQQPTPAMAAPMTPKGPMIPKGGSLGATGPTVQFTSPSASAAEASATTSARIAAENVAAQKREAEFKNSMMAATNKIGKPLQEIGFEDIYKATGNLDMTKKFLDARNAFQGKDTNQQKFVDSSIGIISGLIDFAKKIPVSTGTGKLSNIYGKQVQTNINKIEAMAGSLPDYDAYQTIATLVSPMLVKAFGDSGNVPEQQIKLVGPALQNLASGSQALRDSSRKILEVIFTNVNGKPVTFSSAPTTTRDISTQDLIKMLQPSGGK